MSIAEEIEEAVIASYEADHKRAELKRREDEMARARERERLADVRRIKAAFANSPPFPMTPVAAGIRLAIITGAFRRD